MKTRRKAIDVSVVNPLQLWDLFHNKFPQGIVNPHDFDCLGPKFNEDISKVQFDFENWEYNHLEEQIGNSIGFLGYRKFWTRSPLTCFSFIGFQAGGDWEYPINFLVYLDQDGKTFRGYIPKEGNVWNYKTKQAFGNDEDEDAKFLKVWMKEHTTMVLDDWKYSDSSDAEIMSDPKAMAHEMMLRFEAVKGR